MRRQQKRILRLAPAPGLPKARSAGRSKIGQREQAHPTPAVLEAAVRTERRRLLQPLWNALDEQLGPRAAQGLLLAVSGGPDSRALLEAAARWPGRFLGEIHVVCVDHGTRASSSDEAVAVVARARALGFDAAVARVHPLALDEATLRKARYQALAERARALGLASIVVAHHESDVAEGALLSWLGQGGAGAAMQRARPLDAVTGADAVDVVRPFLGLSRATLRLALTGAGAHDVIVDPERASRRAGVRHDELAALGGRRVDVEDHLARAARRRRDDEEVLGPAAQALLEVGDDGVRVRAGPPALLRRALRRALALTIPGVDGRDSSPAVDVIVELMRRGKTGRVHLKGALAHVDSGGVEVRSIPDKSRTVAAEPASTHDGLDRLSAAGSLVTLPPRRSERSPHESIEDDSAADVEVDP